MPMPIEALEAALREGFPDAQIEVQDLAGDGDHYKARIVSPAFKGLPRVKQHQLVYAALKGRVGGELHALALETSAPA
ncbi:BolA family protein [Phenylobacterium soli]|uniref:BolA family transcriptional regulator n=1 Tax=Phenylobacterium soli TaxID=2170551 RepID=A0A328AJS6_9CAUL|nr:BolA family transcriptional regulator [Phenylobacterium soli]RAK54731.1 BolA family transcriptional regulator [Phenylobacterium soli]